MPFFGYTLKSSPICTCPLHACKPSVDWHRQSAVILNVFCILGLLPEFCYGDNLKFFQRLDTFLSTSHVSTAYKLGKAGFEMMERHAMRFILCYNAASLCLKCSREVSPVFVCRSLGSSCSRDAAALSSKYQAQFYFIDTRVDRFESGMRLFWAAVF